MSSAFLVRRGAASVVVVVGVAAVLALGACSHTGARTTTVIQPPTPPGLPKAKALRVPNPPGLPPPPSLGNFIRVEKEPPDPVQAAAVSASPFPGAVLQPGYWAWENEQYVWIEPKWAQPPAGYTTWIAPRWEQRTDGWVFVAGYWQ